ncbi:serine--tRNA ligase [Candidatus Hepatobacter penaei]|uniref:serine--tRNA ligase n=1 Tax=Candidatus Hepatobacter penaei TaxID=1274402 RepID=UPI0004F2AA61|nr:serine--tRNA ligase [Candidatus Hepatobacter penaei]
MKWVREHPDLFDHSMKVRGVSARAQTFIEADKELRALQAEVDEGRAQSNLVARKMGQAKAQGQEAKVIHSLMEEGTRLRGYVEAQERIFHEKKEALHAQLSQLPNILAEDVPQGKSEAENICIRTEGTLPIFDFDPRPHEEVGASLGLSLEEGARLAGSRFVVLKGGMAHLERALANFMLDMHTQHFGYEEISVPYLVTEEALYGTGQLPKFAADSFQTTDGRWLIPTSEVSLANLVRGMTLEATQLPLRYTAYTPCFRSEAGAAGRDTRGIIRLHQFAKVELVSVVRPEEGVQEHERMLSHAEAILTKLGLPYRVMLLCAGDTGFSAQKTYDLEVWFPSQQKYREISSCSLCGDFQARRMGAKWKDGKNKGFVHTLNGSGLAVGRTLAAMLEHYQKKDGFVHLPSVLEPYINTKVLRG